MNTREYEDQISEILVMLASIDHTESVIGSLYRMRVHMHVARLEEQLASHRPSNEPIPNPIGKPVPKPDLPPMQPLKPKVEMNYPKYEPGTGRLRADSPSLVACPVCDAPKGRICLGLIGETQGKPLAGKSHSGHTPSPGWHDERRKAAQAKRGDK